jgi:hypothetical protein
VTRDHARKKAIRARMAASGEPYSVAARNFDAAGGVAASEIIARVGRTLAEPSAHIEFRTDLNVPPFERRGSPGPMGRLAKRAAKAVWARAGGKEFGHSVGDGILEPAAGRYMIDYGWYAQISTGGRIAGGQSGALVQPRHFRAEERSGELLWLLRLLPRTTEASPAGDEIVRGTLCRKFAVTADSVPLTVWIDTEHVRRVQLEEHAQDPQPRGRHVSRELTLELWDFGVSVETLDWSRLPSFRTPS